VIGLSSLLCVFGGTGSNDVVQIGVQRWELQ
jgi:hypothetical protein